MRGLSAEEVVASRAAHGSNRLREIEGRSFLALLREALSDRTLQILLVAAGAVLLVDLYRDFWYFFSKGHYVEGTAIGVAVAIAALVTAYNDWRAQAEFKGLQLAREDHQVRVMRDGRAGLLSAFELVVGDIVELEAGDRVPADAEILHADRLQLDESMLTGESEAVERGTADVVRRGSLVVGGRAMTRVSAVGEQTEYGRLRAQLAVESDPTPLQERLASLADRIAGAGLAASLAVLLALVVASAVAGELAPDPSGLRVILGHVVVAVTIVVVAVPEGLPVAVTISLAYSVMAMARDRSLVRRLVACETMGAAQVLCVDKTGTLTQNRMTARRLWFVGAEDHEGVEEVPRWAQRAVGEVASLASTAHLADDGAAIGSATEAALLRLVRDWGDDHRLLREAHPVEERFGFTSDRKRMSVVSRVGDDLRVLVKGAPEVVLARCTHVLGPAGLQPLDRAMRAAIAERLEAWGGEALRTLALARREMPADATEAEVVERDLALVALVGLGDPVRPGVREAIEQCRHAGVEVKMVTGDARRTAEAVASELGMLGPGDEILDGSELRGLSDEALAERLPRIRVVARAVPSDKLRLVSCLRAEGLVVGVTGDGTNDGPALRHADVGLSMGLSGTDVAREASDIVILDDDFTSVARAIGWGRAIFGNIRKFLQFQLTVSAVALGTSLIAAMTGHGTPLTVVQLLWINLVMDTLAALALALERPSAALLRERPHGRDEPLITAEMWAHIGGMGALMVGVLVGLMRFGHDPTVLFAAFVWMQLGNLANCRTTRFSGQVWAGLRADSAFVGIAALIAGVQVGILAFGGSFFAVRPLSVAEWALSLGLGAAMLPAGALLRRTGRRLPSGWFETVRRWLDQPVAHDPLEVVGGLGLVAILVGLSLRALGPIFTPWGFALFAAGAVAAAAAAWERRGQLTRHDPRSLRLHTLASVALAAVLLVQVNVVGARHYARLDVTAGRRFSASPQTRTVLQAMAHPVRLTGVFRPGALADDVRDLLEAYRTAGIFVEVEHIDPDRDPGAAERLADRLGLSAPPLGSVVVEYHGRSHVVTTEDLLERQYEYRNGRRYTVGGAPPLFRGEQVLTSTLVSLSTSEAQVVCFATGHGEREPTDFGSEGVALLRDRLRRLGYRTAVVRLGDRTSTISGECDVLVQAGPRRPLGPRVRRALDEWLQAGGRWLLSVEPWEAGELDELLASWGIEVRPMYVADPDAGIAGSGPTTLVASSFQPHPIGGGMKGLSIVLPYTTAVRTRAPEHPVVGANLVVTGEGGIGETDRTSRSPRFDRGVDRKGEISVAAAVEETLASYKAEGRPGPARIVVLGDTDLLTNAHLHRMGNADFAINTVDWLARRESLIEVRARPTDDRRISLSTSTQASLYWLSIGVIPGGVALLGGVVAWRRRR